MASVEVGSRYPLSFEERGDRGGIRALANDLLFARITPCLENGKVALVPPHLERVGGSTEFIVIRPPSGISPTYLYYWSLHPEVRNQAQERMTGTTGRMRLSPSDLSSIELPVAPVNEQDRIVTAIEEAFSKLDAGEAGLRTVRHQLKVMRDAVLAAAVAGQLVPQDPADESADQLVEGLGVEVRLKSPSGLPSGWLFCELRHVTALQEYGISLKAHEVRVKGDLPILRMGNIQSGAIDPTHLKFVSAEGDQVQARLLMHGDLLFNRTNSAELVGKSAVYLGVPGPATFASYLIRVRLVPGVDPSFCSAVINSRSGRRYIESVAVQQVGQANVNGTKLKHFPLPLPPAAEQVRIVKELERQMSFIEAGERAVNLGLARSAALRRSILRAAFDGRLVPQDPTDEPASVLLDRIRADRQVPVAEPVRRGRKKAAAS